MFIFPLQTLDLKDFLRFSGIVHAYNGDLFLESVIHVFNPNCLMKNTLHKHSGS